MYDFKSHQRCYIQMELSGVFRSNFIFQVPEY